MGAQVRRQLITCPECEAALWEPAGYRVIECGACKSSLTRADDGTWTAREPLAPAGSGLRPVERAAHYPMTTDHAGRHVPVCMGCGEAIDFRDRYAYGHRATETRRRTRMKCQDLSDKSHQSRSAYGVTREWTKRRAGSYDVVERGYLCLPCRKAEPTWVGRERQ
jgi:hypothetical protein